MNTTPFKHFGRMNDPHASAFLKGICGDEMEFYLLFDGNIISDVSFYTDGCGYTLLCGETAARLVAGKTVDEALGISPAALRNEIQDLPDSHLHCTILATLTILKALADYLYTREYC
jgi:nitrogen fixation NifU-like protein